MKKLLIFVLGVVLFVSSATENNNKMFVEGNIQGLKKGTLYLQKQVDSLVVSIDSVKVNGSQDFMLTDEVLSPEMYYLALGDSDKKIPFFGEKDTIIITSKLDKFVLNAKISGSENQDILNNFYEMKDKFRDQNLDMIKEELEAKISGAQDSVLMVQNKMKNLVRRKYLFTTNFAINNADFEVAPYIALTELNDAAIKLLDTVNNSLSPKVKASTYGVQLNEFILKIKEVEQ